MINELEEGRQLRDDGAQAVAAAQDKDDMAAWRENARAAISYLASTGAPFNADNIMLRVGKPARRNAMGALFLWAVRRGEIERIGERQMIRREAHARRTALYRGANLTAQTSGSV